MHKYYEICACVQDIDGTIEDKSKPFKTYFIEASSKKDAIDKLHNSLPGMNIVRYGEPIEKTMSDNEYNA